jgi:hypothetical protein
LAVDFPKKSATAQPTQVSTEGQTKTAPVKDQIQEKHGEKERCQWGKTQADEHEDPHSNREVRLRDVAEDSISIRNKPLQMMKRAED